MVERCPIGEDGKRDVEEVRTNHVYSLQKCFGSGDDEKFQDTDISQVWRLWLFQGKQSIHI
jgi:hypothetical protein